MIKFYRLAQLTLLNLLVLNFALSACAQTVAATSPPVAALTNTPVVSPGNPVGGYVDLIDQLRAGGATVEPNGEVIQDFFSVDGQAIQLNGADVQVFEYADEAARKAESSLITEDGQPNPTTMVTWLDRPNFWATGRVIVLYLGKDADVMARLTAALGEPITK